MYTRNAGFWLALASVWFSLLLLLLLLFCCCWWWWWEQPGLHVWGEALRPPPQHPSSFEIFDMKFYDFDILWFCFCCRFLFFVPLFLVCIAGGLLLLAKLFAMLFVTMFVILFLMISFTILFSFATWSRAWCCVWLLFVFLSCLSVVLWFAVKFACSKMHSDLKGKNTKSKQPLKTDEKMKQNERNMHNKTRKTHEQIKTKIQKGNRRMIVQSMGTVFDILRNWNELNSDMFEDIFEIVWFAEHVLMIAQMCMLVCLGHRTSWSFLRSLWSGSLPKTKPSPAGVKGQFTLQISGCSQSRSKWQLCSATWSLLAQTNLPLCWEWPLPFLPWSKATWLYCKPGVTDNRQPAPA